MQKVRRCYLTLVELMIVMAILLMITGGIGINVRKALQEQRFRTEVDIIVDTLRLAQDLMLILGADVHYRMWGDDKGIYSQLKVEGDIPKVWEPIIKRSERIFKEIHSVELKGDTSSEIDIKFLSGGSLMTRGVLRMSTHQEMEAPGSLRRDVFLLGYPHAIQSFPEIDKPLELKDEENVEYNNSLTSFTIQEILNDEPPEKTVEPAEGEAKSQEQGTEAPLPPP